MELTPIKTTLAGALALAISPLAAQPPPGPPAPACEEANGYVCNQQGPEDLIAMGDEWAVSSAFNGTGGLALIRIADRQAITAYPADTATNNHDMTTYPDCPGPPDTSAFTTHGLYVVPGGGPEYRLFVVGHGERESIEIFDVDASADVPTVSWRGCAVAPDPIGLNSVRALPDGGFITTNFNPRNSAMTGLMSGEVNGELWEWHTDSGWEIVPGSEASGANGVELSDDLETIYVATWGDGKFFRLSRGANPPVREEIEVGFRIDNIHWADDGRLIGAGQRLPNLQGWRVVKIDPDTLEVETIYEAEGVPGFVSGTAAIEIGDELWVGSFTGDRIAIVPAP